MKVFISWSGDKSHEAAVALRDWLRCVINSVEPFMSSQDIGAGSRWEAEVASELESTSCGIICVTRDNQAAPWLNFEAGALAKTLDSARVIPFAVDLQLADISMPLGQFQGQPATKAGLLMVVKSINAMCPVPLPDELLAKTFDRWWPDLEEELEKIQRRVPMPPDDVRGERDLLEEVVTTVRSIARELQPPDEPVIAARSVPNPYNIHDLVSHDAFGPGIVMGTEPGGIVEVLFEDGSHRKLMWEYAPLHRLPTPQA